MINQIVKVKDNLVFSNTLINNILQTSKKLRAKIILKRNNHIADCNSVLEVLLLGVEDCPQLEIVADGVDEQIALQKISSIFQG